MSALQTIIINKLQTCWICYQFFVCYLCLRSLFHHLLRTTIGLHYFDNFTFKSVSNEGILGKNGVVYCWVFYFLVSEIKKTCLTETVAEAFFPLPPSSFVPVGLPLLVCRPFLDTHHFAFGF